MEFVKKYFQKLGFDDQVAELYLALYAQGPQTISELSRSSGVERTRIYRLLDVLQANNLVEIEIQHKRSIIKPAPIRNLYILITKREQELKELQTELGTVEQLLKDKFSTSPATKVKFYKGPEGVRQMFWNQAQQATASSSILLEPMQALTGERFFERWIIACNKNGFESRTIFGDIFRDDIATRHTEQILPKLQKWQGRHISNTTFKIESSSIIYNDTTGYFNWHEKEIFGIEIINREIAAAQQQLFELLWQRADPNYSSTNTSRQKAT